MGADIIIFPVRREPATVSFRAGDPVLIDGNTRGHFLEAKQPERGEPLLRVLTGDHTVVVRLSRVAAR